MRQTTCHNYECPFIDTCTVDVWKEFPTTCQGELAPIGNQFHYTTRREREYRDYQAKGGKLSFNEYFNG